MAELNEGQVREIVRNEMMAERVRRNKNKFAKEFVPATQTQPKSKKSTNLEY